MNCTHCGGPLSPLALGDGLRCSYCAAYHFPAPGPAWGDRIAPEGATTLKPCPVCLGMLTLGRVDGCPALYCDGCLGLLLESETFGYVVTRRRSNYRGPADEPVPLFWEELQRHVSCPSCGRTMETHPYYGPGNSVIDSCPDCRLVWLDSGELSRIERAPGVRP